MTRISVVIPTGRSVARVRPTVESCLAQEFPATWELILAVNPPSAEHRAWVDSLDTAASGAVVHYEECEERSANRARNIGLARASGEIVYFLDDDCLLPTPHHLRDVVRLHDENPELLGIGGPYRSPLGAPRSTIFYNAYTELWLRRNSAADGSALVLLGGNSSYKRVAGGDDLVFDGSLAYGGTETEFNHRLIARGHRLHLDDAMAVVHDFREGYRRLLWRAWRQGAGKRSNPYEKIAKRERDPSGPPRPDVNDPRPRWCFQLFVLAYYLVVRLGGLRSRRSRQTADEELLKAE